MIALRNGMRRWLASLLLLLVCGSSAVAETRSATMNVSATVIARSVVTVDAAPAEVVVTAADAERGYIVLPDVFAFHVRSNSLGGYLLRFDAAVPAFSRVSIAWGSTEIVVGEGEAQIVQPYRRGATAYSATIRFDLAPGTRPGRYPWPVRIAADTL